MRDAIGRCYTTSTIVGDSSWIIIDGTLETAGVVAGVAVDPMIIKFPRSLEKSCLTAVKSSWWALM